MNIEKTVKNLKNYISFSKKECNFPTIYDWNWNMDLANNIETLLTAYEKEKEKNESLIKERATEIVYVDKNFVRKDKIKAKIEELDKQEKEEPDAFLCKRVLQSLLEKEGE